MPPLERVPADRAHVRPEPAQRVRVPVPQHPLAWIAALSDAERWNRIHAAALKASGLTDAEYRTKPGRRSDFNRNIDDAVEAHGRYNFLQSSISLCSAGLTVKRLRRLDENERQELAELLRVQDRCERELHAQWNPSHVVLGQEDEADADLAVNNEDVGIKEEAPIKQEDLRVKQEVVKQEHARVKQEHIRVKQEEPDVHREVQMKVERDAVHGAGASDVEPAPKRPCLRP